MGSKHYISLDNLVLLVENMHHMSSLFFSVYNPLFLLFMYWYHHAASCTINHTGNNKDYGIGCSYLINLILLIDNMVI